MQFGSGTFPLNCLPYSFAEAKLFWVNPGRQIFYGLPQWAVPTWKGILYPSDCRAQDYLKTYAQFFNCVEVSSTFYSSLAPHTFEQWKKATSPHFKFLPKWPKSITHDRHLEAAYPLWREFIDSVRAFGDQLGPTLLQLPPTFSIDYKVSLYRFFTALPNDFPMAIEFRHSSWFHQQRLPPKLENFLAQKNWSMAISDTPARRDVFHLSFPGPNHLIRYLSDGNNSMDALRLGEWKKWCEGQKSGPDLFFILHQTDNATTPQLTQYLCPEIYQKMQKQKEGPQLNLF